eukprot:TRINITY_DN2717_c0_g1_i2.p3 TRINITY_DN2717_c0_g1~~TRINITY_DN2717_c0_g1_i2.p3  ORF type:complete len:123 (-),score=4.20 TRINITY_DN2717_c0_g1_i2:79-417(-)
MHNEMVSCEWSSEVGPPNFFFFFFFFFFFWENYIISTSAHYQHLFLQSAITTYLIFINSYSTTCYFFTTHNTNPQPLLSLTVLFTFFVSLIPTFLQFLTFKFSIYTFLQDQT